MDIQALRNKQQRNFLATLLLSLGVPMIRGGDEIGHTQHGNNNADCQDNEISWLNWDLSEDQQSLLAFTQKLIQFRHQQPVLHRRKFFQGLAIRGGGIKDVSWFDPSGIEMTDATWDSAGRAIGVRWAGTSSRN